MSKEFNSKKISLVVGLGNPEPEYSLTYHNVGRMLLAALAPFWKKHGWRTIANKGYMNEAGRDISSLLQYYKIAPENLLLLHDDSDLALGDYRLSFGGGSAGHKGVESAIQYLKTQDFWKLRLGIRDTALDEAGRKKAGDFVLSRISADGQKKLAALWPRLQEDLERLSNSESESS